MALLINQIKVLLQRVKMAGREPHKLIMNQGLKECLQLELGHTASLAYRHIISPHDDDAIYHPKQGTIEMTFQGIPILVDNSLKEILIQTKPRPMEEDEPVPNVDWSKIIKMERL